MPTKMVGLQKGNIVQFVIYRLDLRSFKRIVL